MKPTDSEPPDRHPPKPPRGQWVLTPEAFNKLLERLSPDRDEACKEFLAIRLKMARYFEYRHVDSPDTKVDTVIDRVAKKIDEGHQIDNLLSYFYGVAYLVFLESLKDPQTTEIDPSIPAPPPPEPPPEEDELRQRCLRDCLAKLPDLNRYLILEYHRKKGHAKIVLRKELAANLSIPLNALRIRAHRIRVRLENCIKACIARNVQKRNVSG